MIFTKRFKPQPLLDVAVESWLRECGLEIPVSTNLEPDVIRARIKAALNASDWYVYTWDDPLTDEFVFSAGPPDK